MKNHNETGNGDGQPSPPVTLTVGKIGEPPDTDRAGLRAKLAESYADLSRQFKLLTGRPLPPLGKARKRSKPTPQQLRLVKNLTKGMSITDAAIAAGYSDSSRMTAGQCGSQALKAIRRRMPEVLEEHGLTDDVFIEKYLKPLLNAKETKFFQKDGVVTDTRDVEALGTRTTALDMALKLGDKYPQRNEGADAPTTINIEIAMVGGQ